MRPVKISGAVVVIVILTVVILATWLGIYSIYLGRA